MDPEVSGENSSRFEDKTDDGTDRSDKKKKVSTDIDNEISGKLSDETQAEIILEIEGVVSQNENNEIKIETERLESENVVHIEGEDTGYKHIETIYEDNIKTIQTERTEALPEILTKDEEPEGDTRRFSLLVGGDMRYEYEHRTSEPEISREISGDFKKIPSTHDPRVLYNLFAREKVVETDEEILINIEKDQESLIESEDEYTVTVTPDNSFFISKIKWLNKQNLSYKVRNVILHRKIVSYLRRRHLDHSLKEIYITEDLLTKYQNKLDEFGTMIEKYDSETKIINAELNVIQNVHKFKAAILEEKFNQFQQQELEFSRGLIYSKSRSKLSDKLVNTLLLRQRYVMTEMCALRLMYIKIKKLQTAREEAFINFNRVDSQHNLLQFEKLKEDNRSYSDKIEEKEEELTALRKSSMETIEILSHIREKRAAVYNDMIDLKEDIPIKEAHILSLRSRINKTKKERDILRELIQDIKNESGLLSEPELLYDMQISNIQFERFSKELHSLKTYCKETTNKLRNARKTIECLQVAKRKLSLKKGYKKHRTANKEVKMKPNVYNTTLPKTAFDNLQILKPSVTPIM